MQVSNPNDVKIYNLSSGKSLPEWLTEKKRKKLTKKHVDFRRRIELIQNFDMPGISTSIKVSNDGQYILATGIYKPRVKCFDVNNLSLKFERCFDAEVTAFQILSDDYSKLVFLHCDRHIEFHAAPGKYYRLRIPRFGKDIAYHYPTCDTFFVGDCSEIYRLNLERGQFLKPFESESLSINKCCINDSHQLLAVGTQDGKVEAWDPRTKNKVGTLNCALDCIDMKQLNDFQNLQLQNSKPNIQQLESALPSTGVTALKFQGALTMAVGTSTGQILLYDIRSNKPFLVKDHMYGLPIKNIEFHNSMNLVYSMDSSIVKIWEKNTGKLYTSIEANAHADFNDLCTIPNTGMLFLANETSKMCIHYIPSLGPAPKWASFLDNLTEELEESNYETIYDDYKFVTNEELTELGLSHLSGSNLLRAYMHGYFIDARLWSKARQVAQPFSFDDYKKKKIRDKINENRSSRLMQMHQQQQQELADKLPAVNKELAAKYHEIALKNQNANKNNDSKVNEKTSLLKDNRFQALFTNPSFQIDQDSEEFGRHLMGKLAVIKKINKLEKRKKGIGKNSTSLDDSDCDDDNGHATNKNDHVQSDDELFDNSHGDDDNYNSSSKIKQTTSRKRIKIAGEYRNNKTKLKKMATDKHSNELYENKKNNQLLKDRHEDHDGKKTYMKKKISRETLGDRLQSCESKGTKFGANNSSRGNKVMTFTVTAKKRKFMKK